MAKTHKQEPAKSEAKTPRKTKGILKTEVLPPVIADPGVQGFRLDMDGHPDDSMPYGFAQAARLAWVEDKVAMSFFQVNYQFIADQIQSGTSGVADFRPACVAKVVMDRDVFLKFLAKATELARRMGYHEDANEDANENDSKEAKARVTPPPKRASR